MKVQVCKDCRAEGRTGKPLDIYPKSGGRCWKHHNARRRELSARAADQRRAKAYGLAPGDYAALLEAQGGGCGWCGRPRRKGGRDLAVDHDHSCCPGRTSCGECIRGLLCWTCNKMLHHVMDSPEVVERGAEYLRNPPAKLARTARAM